MTDKRRTVVLGVAFLVLLAVSSVESMFFFQVVSGIFHSRSLALDVVFMQVGILFVHNVLVISLILLGMTFYVDLVTLGFFKREKHANVVLEHPRTFALVFTIMVVLLSILRGSSLLGGGIAVEALPSVLLISAPIGMVEGYGIYLTIEKTFTREMSMKHLGYIYGIFLGAAVMEVGFINLLIWVAV